MSLSILNRGASGGLKPELTVAAPSGSTIDIIRNGIIVSTYTLGASEREHTFVVKVGTYAVRGTLGTQTKSKEVSIDAVGQYRVVISYIYYLYEDGDFCEDITGGYEIQRGNDSLIQFNSDHIFISTNYYVEYAISVVKSVNQIDTTGFTKLYAEFEASLTSTTASASVRIGNNEYGTVHDADMTVNTNTVRSVMSANFTAHNSNRYVNLCVYGHTSNVASTMRVYKVWLE